MCMDSKIAVTGKTAEVAEAGKRPGISYTAKAPETPNTINAVKAPVKHSITPRHKELADRFRGGMSYKEHYAYLLDWYANDRNAWTPEASIKSIENRRKAAAETEHMKQSFQDVLDSLVHLDKKIDRVAVISKIKQRGEKVSKARASQRLFTKLIDRVD